jgi:phospholipid/cholesterol/gamma-HCH transport system substrate-binding protein
VINFRSLNPVRIGLVGVLVVAAVLVAALNTDNFLNLTGRGHSALFGEAGGLKSGDPVKVGGLVIGRVTAVELDGPDVRVDFSVDDDGVDLGDDTRAVVGVATILGEKYLKLTPQGGGELPTDTPIPRGRTVAPYDLPDALTQLTNTSQQLDLRQLSAALDSVSSTLDGTAPQLRSAVDGVGRLSQTISSRDQALQDLFGRAQGVTGVLAERSDQLKLLIGDGNLLLGELQARQRTISELLVNASALSQQLNGLVADNREQLRPTLDKLNSALDVLKANQDNIAKILSGLGSYATGLGESVSSGPFFQAYVQNLIPGNLIPLADYLPQLPTPAGAPASDTQGGGR